jgi:hypothetical protein
MNIRDKDYHVITNILLSHVMRTPSQSAHAIQKEMFHVHEKVWPLSLADLYKQKIQKERYHISGEVGPFSLSTEGTLDKVEDSGITCLSLMKYVLSLNKGYQQRVP